MFPWQSAAIVWQLFHSTGRFRGAGRRRIVAPGRTPWTSPNPCPCPLPLLRRTAPRLWRGFLSPFLLRYLVLKARRIGPAEYRTRSSPSTICSVSPIVSTPPETIASRAFTARFNRAISSWFGSTSTAGNVPCASSSTRTNGPTERWMRPIISSHQASDICRLRLELLLASKSEQPLCQRGATASPFQGAIQEPAKSRISVQSFG